MIRFGFDKHIMLNLNVNDYHLHVDLCAPPSSRHFPRKTVDMVESGLQRYSRWPPLKLQPIWAPLFFADFFTGLSWGSVFFCTKRSILSSLAAREDPQKESFNLEKNFFGERQFLHYPLHWLRFLCRNTCWKVYFISGFKPSFPRARTGSQCIVPVSHGLWSTGGHFETSSSYCGVKNIARKAFRLFNLSMWRHW